METWHPSGLAWVGLRRVWQTDWEIYKQNILASSIISSGNILRSGRRLFPMFLYDCDYEHDMKRNRLLAVENKFMFYFF